ncbi:hypothetical protein BPAE_0238g00130 [Botrytis paeoniae]|uniref:Uncharacterized protein n=1 Tax=Botrytis paeoniae TaxID=278948 RepID=A0A4Z1FED8_9HELO|nr:hypothetical protein BPAE_0238g00130 [Botrytis paeoniae]
MGPGRDHDDLDTQKGLLVFVLVITLLWLYSKNKSRSASTLPAIKFTVARFPVNGQAPSLERLETTTEFLKNLPPDRSLCRDYEATQLKNQPINTYNEIYLTIYTFYDGLQENHYTPEVFQTESRMYGDVFVAKLAQGHYGQHGQAVYEDIHPLFLSLPCVRKDRNFDKAWY